MTDVDVVICGLGAMGSAAALHLARRGVRVLALDRYEPGHDRGSSHGHTRIIRLGYFEHPSYVPLLRRAYELWRELERASGHALLHVTGIAEIGLPERALLRGTLASARQHALDHEVLPAPAFMARFPDFVLPQDHVAVLQPDGGFLEAELCVRTQVALAAAAGAQIRCGDTVKAIEPHANGARVVTQHGTLSAGTVIVAAGPWTSSLLPELKQSLTVTREVVAWFDVSDRASFAPDRFPVFIIESGHGTHYGIPPHAGMGIKIAKHHHRNETVHPDRYRRSISEADENLIRAAIADHLPGANGRLLDARTCLYTMTPDGHFIVDRLPGSPSIIVASACSGHGFKFAPVIGEIVADLATRGVTAHDISLFRLGRFQ